MKEEGIRIDELPLGAISKQLITTSRGILNRLLSYCLLTLIPINLRSLFVLSLAARSYSAILLHEILRHSSTGWSTIDTTSQLMSGVPRILSLVCKELPQAQDSKAQQARAIHTSRLQAVCSTQCSTQAVLVQAHRMSAKCKRSASGISKQSRVPRLDRTHSLTICSNTLSLVALAGINTIF